MNRAIASICLAIGCSKTPATSPPPPAVEARDVPAAQAVPTPPRDAPPPPAAVLTLRAPVSGQAANPPLREFDPAFPVPSWTGQGTLTLTASEGDGPVQGTLQAGDLTLRVRGFRAGATVRGALEPESVDDGGTWVWRGMLDARIEGTALRGAWSVSAHGGRYARAGTVGPQ